MMNSYPVDERPLVSVFVITYKHEQFIGQCLQSIVDQQTNFRFEVIVGEDGSPDSTRQICEEYANKYPNIITLLPAEKNMGAIKNGIRTFKACTGKYIAMCEGDDYWCDNSKLQIQVDFLEANPDFSLCFSSVWVKNAKGEDLQYENYYRAPYSDVYGIEDFILSERNLVPTPSVVFRNVLPDPYPQFFVESLVGDVPVQLFAGDKGKAKFMENKLAVYRDHVGGVTKSEANIELGEKDLLKFFHAFNQYTNYRHNKAFQQRFCNVARYHLVTGSAKLKGLMFFRHYLKWFAEYLKYMDKVNIKEIAYYHVAIFAPSLLKTMNRNNK